jgi:hypothetical protein
VQAPLEVLQCCNHPWKCCTEGSLPHGGVLVGADGATTEGMGGTMVVVALKHLFHLMLCGLSSAVHAVEIPSLFIWWTRCNWLLFHLVFCGLSSAVHAVEIPSLFVWWTRCKLVAVPFGVLWAVFRCSRSGDTFVVCLVDSVQLVAVPFGVLWAVCHCSRSGDAFVALFRRVKMGPRCVGSTRGSCRGKEFIHSIEL